MLISEYGRLMADGDYWGLIRNSGRLYMLQLTCIIVEKSITRIVLRWSKCQLPNMGVTDPSGPSGGLDLYHIPLGVLTYM